MLKSSLSESESLVKRILKNYNGKIWVENRVKDDYSKGSNFNLLIPEAI